jgi:hypothetical protein
MMEEEQISEHSTDSYSTEQKIEKSDVIKRTLFSLVYVASTKTSDDYAWSTLKKLLSELKGNYDFLNYIQIGELKNLENNIDDINVVSKMDLIETNKLGRAIQDLIDLYKKYLGKKAGYFFINEFKAHLGEKYHTIIKKMGVDLRLIELQRELSGIESRSYQIKDDHTSNIAYIEKKE